MANVAKGWAIGDTVYVHYRNTINQFVSQTRVVSRANINSSTNESVIEFESGNNVIDGAVVTVFTTAALCSNAILDWVITETVAAATLDAETSVASTVSQASTTLGRVS